MTVTTDHIAYVALGSNVAPRRLTIERALEALADASRSVQCSTLYETTAESRDGCELPGHHDFLNAVAEVTTEKTPEKLLLQLLAIERELGRERREGRLDRTIDLDLLLYDRLELAGPDLEVPHPRMHRRRYVLVPLVEIAPDAWHPTLRCSAADLLARLEGGS